MKQIKKNVSLARHTTIGTGGPARLFGEPETVEELVDLLAWADENELPVAVVGLGSNLLVADDGFAGLALKLTEVLALTKSGEAQLVAGGGASLAVCLHRARAAGLGGLEFACAIPGTVGGAIRMNAGAYGADISGVLKRALVADARGARWLGPAELGMRYRGSDLKSGQVVAAAELGLEPRAEADIRATVAEMQQARKATQPTNKRTFGSVFKNPEHKLTAGQMLEACGLKGYRSGGAKISPRHANFIENAGGARSSDAIALITEARRRSFEQFGVRLEPEVQLLGTVEIPPFLPVRARSGL